MALLRPAGFLVSTRLGFRTALCVSHAGTQAEEALSKHAVLTEDGKSAGGGGASLRREQPVTSGRGE